MLGGRVLHQRLAPVLAPWPALWLQGYGSASGARWSAFLDSLAQSLRDPEAITRACQGARVAFALVDTCLRASASTR
jgi:heme oxygenase (biliverdin-IX-beta and delta-forming)